MSFAREFFLISISISFKIFLTEFDIPSDIFSKLLFLKISFRISFSSSVKTIFSSISSLSFTAIITDFSINFFRFSLLSTFISDKLIFFECSLMISSFPSLKSEIPDSF